VSGRGLASPRAPSFDRASQPALYLLARTWLEREVDSGRGHLATGYCAVVSHCLLRFAFVLMQGLTADCSCVQLVLQSANSAVSLLADK